jgi:hypothetical protein
MKKLQLKDIAGYLPHGLKILYPFKGSNRMCDIEQMKKLFGRCGIGFVAAERMENGAINELHPFLYEIKPILRPPSDLYKPIIHNGEEIIPIVELAKMACQFPDFKWKLEKNNGSPMAVSSNYGFFYSEVNHCFVEQSNLAGSKVCDIKYDLFDFLNELKIDYRGLINAGLAISVYDLEINPYK